MGMITYLYIYIVYIYINNLQLLVEQGAGSQSGLRQVGTKVATRMYIRIYIRTCVQGNMHARFHLAWVLLGMAAGTIFAIASCTSHARRIMRTRFLFFFFLPPTISGGEVKKKKNKKKNGSAACRPIRLTLFPERKCNAHHVQQSCRHLRSCKQQARQCLRHSG